MSGVGQTGGSGGVQRPGGFFARARGIAGGALGRLKFWGGGEKTVEDKTTEDNSVKTQVKETRKEGTTQVESQQPGRLSRAANYLMSWVPGMGGGEVKEKETSIEERNVTQVVKDDKGTVEIKEPEVKKGEVDEEGDVFYDVEEPTQEFLQGSEKGVEEENPSTEKGMLGRMMDKVKSGAQGAKNMGAKALGGSVAFVKDVGVKALKTGVRKGIDYALKPGAFQEDVGKLKNLGDRAVKKVVGGTAVLATKVIKKGVEAAGTAMSYVPVVGGKAKAISDRVVEKFPDDQTIKDKVDKVVDGATYLVGKAGGAAVAVAKKVGGAAVAGTKAVAGKVGEYIPGSVKNVYNNVSKFISDNVGKVKEAGVKKLEAFSVKKGIEMGRSIARKNAQRAKKKTNFFVKIGRMIKKYLPLAFKYVGALIKDSMSPKVDGKRPTAAREKVVRGYFEYLLGVKKIKEGMSDKEIAKIKEGEKNLDTVMVLLKEGLYGADNEARRVARVATGVTLASLMGLDLEKWGNRLMSIIGKRIFDRKVKDETKVDLKAIEKGVIEAEQKAIAAQQAKIKESNLTPGLPGAVTAVKVA